LNMCITLYKAKKIITMNPIRPVAQCVAVRDGRILGVGSTAELASLGEHVIDARFQDKVLMPGFIEGHSHLSQGALWRYVYVGSHDRKDPAGRLWPGLKTLADVVARLQEAARSHPQTAVLGWGFDPISLDPPECDRFDLDRVSNTQPVVLLHASLHIVSVNTRALSNGGYLRTGIIHGGVPIGHDGLPTGELRGPDVMWPVAEAAGLSRRSLASDEAGIRSFAQLCVRTGVTTATDMSNPLTDDIVDVMLRVTQEEDFPVRIVAMQRMSAQSAEEIVASAIHLKTLNTARLRLGYIKVVLDGSIQGFTARILWPGYLNQRLNGIWYEAPERIRAVFTHALRSGVRVHIHTNGDEATELALDCMQEALAACPALDHRFTLQHAQMSSPAQLRRMRSLGLCVNFFANHLYYWGDIHYSQTIGPARAERMNDCASALATGVPFSIHSDAPVTPLAPLFTAWCAVNRLTASGRSLGPERGIEVEQALGAITLGAAYTLGLDAEIGSIEPGKRADFAVLDQDPLGCAPHQLKDIDVWGVVQEGRVFPANPPS
jgi:predicted amidohydrolase YtcJ